MTEEVELELPQRDVRVGDRIVAWRWDRSYHGLHEIWSNASGVVTAAGPAGIHLDGNTKCWWSPTTSDLVVRVRRAVPKPAINPVVVVVGAAFDEMSPRQRALAAESALECTKYEDGKPVTTSSFSEMLRSPKVRDAMLDALAAQGKPATASLQDRLNDVVGKVHSFYPDIRCHAERKMSMRAHEFGTRCIHCGVSSVVLTVSDQALESADSDTLFAYISHSIKSHRPKCVDATCCDPMDRKVDGLTVRECLARYQARMTEGLQQYDERYWDMKSDEVFPAFSREDDPSRPARIATWKRESRYPTGFRLNDAQFTAARTAWSAELARKTKEAREKERAEVVVDDDRWEP